MNAAEITDKLGLHSLRQRHWYASTPLRHLHANVLEPPVHAVVPEPSRIIFHRLEQEECVTSTSQGSFTNVGKFQLIKPACS